MSNRKEKRMNRKGKFANARTLKEEAARVEANMRQASEHAEAHRLAVIKVAEKQNPVIRKPELIQKPKLVQLVVANRRKLVPKQEKVVKENRKPRSSYMSLWEIVKGYAPSTRTSVKGQSHERDYTLITRHIFPCKFQVGIKIPENAQVKHIPGYPESPEHWETMIGDAFLYSDISIKPVSGEWLNGQIEIKVKRVLKPNMGAKEAVYVYVNMYPIENGQVPDHEVVFNSDEDIKTPGMHFGPSSGRYGTFLHLYPLEDAK